MIIVLDCIQEEKRWQAAEQSINQGGTENQITLYNIRINGAQPGVPEGETPGRLK
ncbi:hypothetical protein [Mixta gaviniae]|uniref:hypothetical protein n=1 Tax=Mixta gaviniae TaxID=665914 RepID=UPI00142D2645|nr:hypothetical protein [Mixta gaviniae]